MKNRRDNCCRLDAIEPISTRPGIVTDMSQPVERANETAHERYKRDGIFLFDPASEDRSIDSSRISSNPVLR